MRPMAPAAAMPDRKVVGYDHQTDIGAYVPMAARVMKQQKSQGSRARAAPAIPAAARNMCRAPCQRFSSLCEEEWPVQIEATSDTSIAAAITRPIATFDQPETSL